MLKLVDNLLNLINLSRKIPTGRRPFREERMLRFIKQIENNLMICPFSEKFLVGCALASP